MFETVLSALFDRYPFLRAKKICVTAVISVTEFLLGLLLVCNVSHSLNTTANIITLNHGFLFLYILCTTALSYKPAQACIIAANECHGCNLVAVAHICTQFCTGTQNHIPETDLQSNSTSDKIQDVGSHYCKILFNGQKSVIVAYLFYLL